MREITVKQLSVMKGGYVKNINFIITSGNLLAVSGPNGAGKTTLLRALASLSSLSSGSIRFNGRELTQLDAKFRARRISYLPQKSEIHWALSVRDVVALGLMPFGSQLDKITPSENEKIDRQIESFRLEKLSHRPANELSGGELQRVNLARALVGNPEVLLADEPAAALDPGVQLDVMTKLKEIAASDRIVIFTTHEIRHAFRFADKALLLGEHGTCIGFGEPQLVFNNENLLRCFGIRPIGGEIKEGVDFERIISSDA